MLFLSQKSDWLGNIRQDLLAALVVALALIPEAIAFSIIAGVDPKIGLYSSFCISVVIAIIGGRPGMISAATGAMALIMVTLVKDYGLQYLLSATILCGMIQVLAGYFKLANLMSFVSESVVTGFVNALAILIFMAQLPELTNVTWHVYAITALGLGVIYLFPLIPKIGKVIPSPLICILLCTGLTLGLGIDIRTIGDMGTLPDTLPLFLFPDTPFNLETLRIILPYSLALAVVGLLESLMTATIVDDLTDTKSDRDRECKGQGVANIIAGFLGGMAGCAMIGQSIINIKSGGRGRLSTLMAGIFLLILVVFLGPWISMIPMAALVAIMIMVSIGTFNWKSVYKAYENPLSNNLVMFTTVAIVVWTHNLAYGVLIGVLIAALSFANKISHFMYISTETENKGGFRTKFYYVNGQVFFNSTEKFINMFDYKEVVDKIVINLDRTNFWDTSAVAALDKVVYKLRREGTIVEVIGLNQASQTIIDRFGLYEKPEEIEKVMGASH